MFIEKRQVIYFSILFMRGDKGYVCIHTDTFIHVSRLVTKIIPEKMLLFMI